MAMLSTLRPPPTKAAEVYKKCCCSVVRIEATSYKKGGRRVIKDGSGFVWDKDHRLLVTCCHVIKGAADIRATINDKTGATYEAKVVFSDWKKDVAVLRVDKAAKDKLRPITVGNSEDVCVGEDAFVVGHPFGLGISLWTGVISAVRRENCLDKHSVSIKGVSEIQTDAAINPGNSGGPLLDSSGPKKEKIQERLGHCGHFHKDVVGYLLGVVPPFEGYMILEELRFCGKAKMHNGVALVCRGICKKCAKIVVGILPCDHVKFGRALAQATVVDSDECFLVQGKNETGNIWPVLKTKRKVIVEVSRGDQKEKIPVILEPKPD